MGEMKPGDWVVFGLLLLMALAPLVAATVFTHRVGRRGWWLAAPWAGLAGLMLACLQIFHSLQIIRGGLNSTAFLAAGLISAWFTLTIFLIVLTVAGPKLAPPGVGRRS